MSNPREGSPESGGSPPRFSVIIPCLNEPAVDRTIAALIAQDFQPEHFEIILVGMDLLGRMPEDRTVRFERTDQPLTPSAARNRGARLAAFEILSFLDADCIPESDWLGKLAQVFRNPAVSVVGGGVLLDGRSPWETADNLAMFHESLSIRPPGRRAQLASLNMAIRADVFNQAGGFDERYVQGEDSDLSFRLRRLGYPLYFEPSAAVSHFSGHHSLKKVLMHHMNQGRYSTKMDFRHAADNSLPWPFRSRLMVLVGSPLLAAAATFRLYAASRPAWRYLALLPVVYLAKLAWCVGAATHVYPRSDKAG
jgi:GT2 family glycosyltransferase